MGKLENLNLFIDRLRERQYFDRWAFLLLAFGGSAAILVFKSQNTNTVAVAAGAALLMLLYAFLAGYGATKLRADQAGDNCYYLGLIYTLASLSFAIFTFDPANTATTIVQGFGVALATTVVGLVLRVFFSQSRADLAESEENVRVALTEAAAQVRAQLDGVVQAFATFAHQTQQHLQELHDEVSAQIKTTSETARASVEASAAEASEAIEAQVTETVTTTKKVSTAVTRLVSNLEGHADAVGEVTNKSRGQLAHLEALEAAAQSTRSVFSHVSEVAAKVQSEQSALVVNTDRFAGAAEALANSVASVESATARFDEAVKKRLGEIKRFPADEASAAERAMKDVIAQWSAAVDALAAKQEEIVDRLDKAQAGQVEALDRHNLALEGELAKSRDYVGKVHTALVDMTEKLADKI